MRTDSLPRWETSLRSVERSDSVSLTVYLIGSHVAGYSRLSERSIPNVWPPSHILTNLSGGSVTNWPRVLVWLPMIHSLYRIVL